MPITPYRDIDAILHSLLAHMQRILDRKLIGVYLYGSLVTGDFDLETSDIDLVAVLTSELDDREFDQLHQMHTDLINHNRNWEDRIEIAYLSSAALKTYRSQASTIAVISPGEPFHYKEAGKEWLINWWVVREKGVTLLGPPPTAFIDPISEAEFRRAVREQVQAWHEYIVNGRHSRPYQAYAILTLCRALHVYITGEQVSKRQAALWAVDYLPEWAPLIHNALAWRAAWRDTTADPDATYPRAVSFVHFVADYIARR